MTRLLVVCLLLVACSKPASKEALAPTSESSESKGPMDELMQKMETAVERERAGLPPLEPPKPRAFELSVRGYYWLLEPPAPWGDYGDMLLQGMGEPEGVREGPLELRRTGPFVPPISFPAMASAVVTAALRKELEAANLSGLKFSPVKKARIIEADWRKWDRTRLPPELLQLTPDGEPETVLDGPHSQAAADAMGELWELLPERVSEPRPGLDVSRIGGRLVVSRRALDVLTKSASSWFETLPVEKDPYGAH